MSLALLLATEDSETPGERVTRANRLLCRDVGDSGRFMTLLGMEVRPRSGVARYVRAMADGFRRVGIDLPARQTVQLRHGQRYHLMLVNLKQPLIQGDSFVITLQFEKAGPLDVQVSVQTPKAGQDDRDHKH